MRKRPFEEMLRVPLWARILGYFRSRKNEASARRAAILKHQTPVVVATIVGQVRWSDEKPQLYPGHLWELMEAPNGKRVVRHTKMGAVSGQESHPLFAHVKQWESGLLGHYRKEDGSYWFNYPKSVSA